METIADLPLTLAATDWWALCWPALLVALLRIGDVTVNVFKVTCMVHGRRSAAAAFAALEAAIWLSAAGLVFTDLTVARGLGFIAGVSAGTFLGMLIVDRAKLGLVTVRVFVAANEGRELAGHIIAERIRRNGHGATVFPGYGHKGEVHMVLSVVKRRVAQGVCDLVRTTDPTSFVAIDNEPGPQSSVGMARARV
jgi:uncharacterized protein YebE (UPF0316 family)